MPQKINSFNDGSYIEFDSGRIDDWCVFVIEASGKRFAPVDSFYFSRLKILGEKHGHRKIYNDFVVLFDRTTKNINPKIFSLIKVLSESYNEDAREIELWYNVLYAGMIAEENKQHAVLKKRIKRLGMHQVLIDNLEPGFAAGFSRGKKWRDLDKLMKAKGF